MQDICESLESEKASYKELKTRSVGLLQDPESHNKTTNKVESIDILFNRVLELAVVKQHSLEKSAVQLQRLDTGIENLIKVVGEIESMLPLEKIETSDAELKEHLELYQVCLLLCLAKLN